jgi:predicted cupin superfamily sugar epimerase
MSEPVGAGHEAARLIRKLGLSRHPEGGWYRETVRVASAAGGRDQATAILFLLERGQRSHWHRVDATEIWFWHAGSGSRLALGRADEGAQEADWLTLGPDVLAGETVQAVIAAGQWQAAHAIHGWALVSCVVAPAFTFDGFELAPPDWHPGRQD